MKKKLTAIFISVCMGTGVAAGYYAVNSNIENVKKAVEAQNLTSVETSLNFKGFINDRCSGEGETLRGSLNFTAKDKNGNTVTGVYCNKHAFAKDRTPSVKIDPKTGPR